MPTPPPPAAYRFKPGNSGGDWPLRQTVHAIKAAIAKASDPHTAVALHNHLAELALDPKTKPKDKVAAIVAWFDRAVGKPKQEVDIDVQATTQSIQWGSIPPDMLARWLSEAKALERPVVDAFPASALPDASNAAVGVLPPWHGQDAEPVPISPMKSPPDTP